MSALNRIWVVEERMEGFADWSLFQAHYSRDHAEEIAKDAGGRFSGAEFRVRAFVPERRFVRRRVIPLRARHPLSDLVSPSEDEQPSKRRKARE